MEFIYVNFFNTFLTWYLLSQHLMWKQISFKISFASAFNLDIELFIYYFIYLFIVGKNNWTKFAEFFYK